MSTIDSTKQAAQALLAGPAVEAKIGSIMDGIAILAVERARLIAGSRLDSESKRRLLARLAVYTSPDGVAVALNRRCETAARKVVADAFSAFRLAAADAIASLSLDTPAAMDATEQALVQATEQTARIKAQMRDARRRERDRIKADKLTMRLVK